MTVRIGVDVGGTFTKAVACDALSGEVMCRAITPTTPDDVHAGITTALMQINTKIEQRGLGPVVLVAHSTTQAVNALLEGDTAVVGVLGLGRPPDLRKAHKRTHVGEIKLAPSRTLRTEHGFLDTSVATRADYTQAIRDLIDRGATALCVSEAFGVDDPSSERVALEVAAELGIPACAGHELSGLYGLELRTVTSAINASILPVTLTTARTVEQSVEETLPGTSVVIMRGDGGAADVETMRHRPLLTAFSGPAASVAGALRHLALRDAVVIEVGGTSTNVSVVRGGRPVLSYIRVLEHTTAVRSLDVRVTGVAGGSMIRLGRRKRMTGVGPRSAHIAGLEYCSFAKTPDLDGAHATLISPKVGDPCEYVVIETMSGQRYALTPTCAANALGHVPDDAYASGNAEASRIGFEALAEFTGGDWKSLAAHTLDLAAENVAGLVAKLIKEHALDRPTIVGVGGGAGALVGEVAGALGLNWQIPPDAEVISSVGDALSLIRLEIERGLATGTGEDIAKLINEAEEAAEAAGADPESLQIETHAVPERGAMRAIALGAVALNGSTRREAISDEAMLGVAVDVLGPQADAVAATQAYSVFAAPGNGTRPFVLLDKAGAVVVTGEGMVITGSGYEVAGVLEGGMPELTRHLGPFTVAPAIRIVRNRRLIDLSLLSSPGHAINAAVKECELGDGHPVVALVTRS